MQLRPPKLHNTCIFPIEAARNYHVIPVNVRENPLFLSKHSCFKKYQIEKISGPIIRMLCRNIASTCRIKASWMVNLKRKKKKKRDVARQFYELTRSDDVHGQKTVGREAKIQLFKASLAESSQCCVE